MKELEKLLLLSKISGELAYRKSTSIDEVYNESYGNKCFAVMFWILLHCPKSIDLLKCLLMAMFYNLHNWRNKNSWENDYIIVEEIAEKLNKPQILWVFEEFSENKTDEARFVHKIIGLETSYHLNYLRGKADEISKLICDVKDTDRGGFCVRLEKKRKNGKKKYNTNFIKGLYETDGDHIFSLCLLLYLLNDRTVDLLECLCTAILHDLAEGVEKKDYTPMCGCQNKAEHEQEIMIRFANLCNRPDFLEKFENYNRNEIPTYIRVKSADKMEFFLKTIFYWKRGMFPLSEVKDVYSNYQKSFYDKIKDAKVIVYMNKVYESLSG